MAPIAQSHSPFWARPCGAGPMQPGCTWEHLLTPHWPSTFTASQQPNAVLLAGKFTGQHVCPAGSLLMETSCLECDSSVTHNHRKDWDSFNVQVLGKKKCYHQYDQVVKYPRINQILGFGLPCVLCWAAPRDPCPGLGALAKCITCNNLPLIHSCLSGYILKYLMMCGWNVVISS